MAPTLATSSIEVLAGLVDRVTFHNSDNGFCVLRVKARGERDLITLVGHAAMRADAVAVQEQHDLADDLLLGPAHDNPLGALGADAGHLSQTMRFLLDDIKTVSP